MAITLSFLEKKKFLTSRKNYEGLASLRGQMKIQQMAFMIMAVSFFFVFVGLFFVGVQFGGIGETAQRLQEEQALSSLRVIADMPELNYDSSQSMALDEDKLKVMSGKFGEEYEDFWPVASIKVYKVYPRAKSFIECPGLNCNYFNVYDGGKGNGLEFSSYVSICKKVSESGYTYDRCEVGKLVLEALDVTK